MLVVEGARSLYQGLSGKGAARQVGGQRQSLGCLLGVELAASIHHKASRAAGQGALILTQPADRLVKGRVRPIGVHSNGKQQPFPGHGRLLKPGCIQFLRRQSVQGFGKHGRHPVCGSQPDQDQGGAHSPSASRRRA